VWRAHTDLDECRGVATQSCIRAGCLKAAISGHYSTVGWRLERGRTYAVDRRARVADIGDGSALARAGGGRHPCWDRQRAAARMYRRASSWRQVGAACDRPALHALRCVLRGPAWRRRWDQIVDHPLAS